MGPSLHTVTYTDLKSLSVELAFAFACDKVEGRELSLIVLSNTEASKQFVTSVSRLLRGMKRSGDIQLYLFESEIDEVDKKEAVYLLNKFPWLRDNTEHREIAVYVKL